MTKTIKGSPKQIAWAEQIRQTVIENKEKARVYIVRGAKDEREDKADRIADMVMKKIDSFINEEDRAENWIDTFGILTSKYAKKPQDANMVGCVFENAPRFGITCGGTLWRATLQATKYLPGAELHRFLNSKPGQ